MTEIGGLNQAGWAELRARRSLASDQLVTSDVVIAGIPSGILMAVDSMGDLGLLIHVNGPPVRDLPADTNGLRIQRLELSNASWLKITSNAAYERVFTPFCLELVRAVAIERRDPWNATATVMNAWQSAWRPVKVELDKAAQTGLYGELWVLENLLIPSLGSSAIARWTGPDYERHDFCGRTLHIEVKATRGQRLEFRVSRADQLRPPPGKELFLAAVRLEESRAGNETIAGPISRITQILQSDPGALDLFMGLLSGMGWHEGLIRSGQLFKYNYVSAHIFRVEGNFPRLPDDFVLPRGVVKFEYSIDLGHLEELDETAVNSALLSM